MTTDLSPDAALVVIDVQRGFDDSQFWGRRDNPDAETNIGLLVTAWSASGRPIVLVRHDSVTPGSPLGVGAVGNTLKDVVAGAPHDLLVTKHVNSAFLGEPDLDGWLRERGIAQLVLCGIQTNMCVETTARMGGNLGYDVIVAIDACHTFDLSGAGGLSLTAEQLTTATVVNLTGGGFARVAPTRELV
ncbi:cysteine hydrolase family protein [Leifsonia sp. NPDC058292]|uniref:cysteine hydrolase family protein n=1 Tax=Leifsonia sp. NPDC058292 TaxID=3346428 RepID=UPI0036D8F9E7